MTTTATGQLTFADIPTPKARASDPIESHLAAEGKDDSKAAREVEPFVRDGKLRTDTEIYEDMRAAGYEATESRARHGRLHLQREGKLAKIGRVPKDPATGRGPFAVFQWVHHAGGKQVECGAGHAAWLTVRGQRVELKHD